MEIYEKRSIRKFLLLAFGIAWALQLLSLAGASLGGVIGQLLYTVCNALCMFGPGIAVAIVCKGLKAEKTGIRWNIKSRQVLKGMVPALGLPMVLTLLGMELYFLLFPGKFGTDNPTFQTMVPAAEAAGMSVEIFFAVYFVGGAISGGFINMFFALGEEIGWTGYLVPALTTHVGEKRAVLLRGGIWGVWHWPLIFLAGYEYGVGYWGAPFTGMLMMLLFTTGMGVIMVWLYQRSDSIWIPALGHGVLNAIAAFPILFLVNGTTAYLLGPTIAGGIAGIPMLLLAFLLWRKFEA